MNVLQKRKEGMKQLIRPMLFLLCLFAMASVLRVPSFAQHERVGITLSDAPLGESGYLIGGVTLVPFRAFVDSVDHCEVGWNAATRTAHATTSGGARISARVGDEFITFGERVFFTAAPNRIVGDRLYVAVRALAKCFGVSVQWNAASRSVRLQRSGTTPRHDAGVYDADALYWLSHIIAAEARGEPFRGQLAVGNVVLNRVDSREYPNTIYDVIFDRRYGVQFTPTASGSIYAEPTPDAVRAAKVCLEGYTLSDRILYFFNPRIAQSHWISQNCTYAFRIGSHVFYI